MTDPNTQSSIAWDSPKRSEPLLLASTALALLPVIGIGFGSVSIVWGLAKRSKAGIRIALCSGAFIVIANFVSVWLFFAILNAHPALLQRIVVNYAQDNINALAVSVEEYRAKYGSYPESLDKLHKSQSPGVIVTVIDPVEAVIRKRRVDYYYRRLSGDRYYLRSAGLGGVIFNDDDILPKLPPELKAKSGLALSPI